MNDFLRNFVMNTIRKMIENNVDEWQVRQYGLGWYEKTVLTQEDLQEIETRYAEKEAQRLAELEAQRLAELEAQKEAEQEEIEAEEEVQTTEVFEPWNI